MSETPYSSTEQPGDDDWTSHAPQGQPRYAASASVPPPVPPTAPAFGQPPASGFGQPPASGFGQPPASGFGQPPASGFGQPAPAGPGSPPSGQPSVGQARVAASASVPAAPPSYGPPPQGYPSQAGVYGTPAGQAGPPAQAGQYGSAAPATYGQPAQGFGQPPASGFGQPGNAPGGPGFGGPAFQSGPGGPGGGPANMGGGQFGQQPNSGHGGPPPGFNAPSYNQGYQGESDRRDYDDEPAPASTGRRPRRTLIIGLVAAVLLVVVGIGGFVGYKLTNRSADYAVGTCVLKDDTSAKVVDCGTNGAFKITSLEDAVSKCPDIFQPSLALPSAPAAHRYACLAPMAAE